jgi:hypothetical protein
MDSLPIWAIWSTIPGVVVLAPVLAFLLATATVIIIGLLKEVAVPAVLAFTAAGISGWLLARKARARSRSLSGTPPAWAAFMDQEEKGPFDFRGRR